MSCESEIDVNSTRFRLQEMRRAPWHVLSARELAHLLGVSLQVLANWRVRAKGPAPSPSSDYPGNRTFYRVSAIDAWLRGLQGECVDEWQVTAEWLMQQYIFPVPLQCEERTWRVVQQLSRWNIFPPLHRKKSYK
jgi:hypothetical protein